MNPGVFGWVIVMLGAAMNSRTIAATLVADCDVIRSSVDRALTWKSVAEGLEFADIKVKSEYLQDLTLLRYSNDVFQARPFDLRDIVSVNQSKGYYAPPLFSINELKRRLRHATIIASAGLTRSYSEPVPAGFLRVDGTTRASVAPKDKIIDGVVCFSQDSKVSILSEMESGNRRAPQNVDRCFAGFQAGPVLVADGAPTSSEHKLKTARVVLGLSSNEYTVIGYTSSATTAALGCAVTSPKVGTLNAINLQGDTLGGIALGQPLDTVAPTAGLGNTDATIASALVIESRPSRKRRTQSTLAR